MKYNLCNLRYPKEYHYPVVTHSRFWAQPSAGYLIKGNPKLYNSLVSKVKFVRNNVDPIRECTLLVIDCHTGLLVHFCSFLGCNVIGISNNESKLNTARCLSDIYRANAKKTGFEHYTSLLEYLKGKTYDVILFFDSWHHYFDYNDVNTCERILYTLIESSRKLFMSYDFSCLEVYGYGTFSQFKEKVQRKYPNYNVSLQGNNILIQKVRELTREEKHGRFRHVLRRERDTKKERIRQQIQEEKRRKREEREKGRSDRGGTLVKSGNGR